MSESNQLHIEKIIQQNTVSFHAVKSAYWDDFPATFVLYVETSYDARTNQTIADNLDKIQKIYAAHDLEFLYLPSLLRDDANVFKRIYPGAELNRTIRPENITSEVTARLFAELHVSNELQGTMLLTRSSRWEQENAFELTRLKSDIPIGELFQTHARMHTYDSCVKYSKVLTDYEPEETNDPEMRFDTEVNRVVSEIDERIRFLKEKGLFRLLSDIIAPMLKSEPSRLRVTEDFRLFLPDYNNMEISLNPLSKVVYFLFLRHPEGIFIKNLILYRYELTQIYRLLSHRDNLEDMNESIRKLTDPSDNSIYEKCSRIKREFLRNMSDDLARNYYIKSDAWEAKQIKLPRTLLELPDALKNIQIPHENQMDIAVSHTYQLLSRMNR